MSNVGWIIAKIMCRLGGGKEAINKYLRRQGIAIGEGTKIASQLKTAEPYLISIGDNVTISHGVDFITHDNSVCKIFGVDHDLYGKIEIGNNCFIGAHSVIMYGVTLPENVIVGAGSVVTKSFDASNIIIAGNPAKIVGTWEQYGEKVENNVIHAGHLNEADKKKKVLNSGRLIKR